MKQRFSTDRKGRVEFPQVQRIVNTGFSGFRIGLLLVGALVASVAGAQTPAVQKGLEVDLTFTKSFALDTIGPGGVSTLTFTITNNEPTGVTGLAFTDVLPAAVTIATPASATTDCVDGIVTAAGGTISLSGGRLGSGESCTVSVNVTSSTAGTHMNVSGVLMSDSGMAGTASDDLTVDESLPGFSKSFSPSSIPPGGTSTLTFTINNMANSAGVAAFLFDDFLPTGMVIASPSNVSSDCGTPPTITPIITAVPGTASVGVVTLGFLPTVPAVAAMSSCTVTVDVTTSTTGMFVNTSEQLLSGPGFPSETDIPSGVATAVLNVPVDFLTKSFTDDPVPPGGTVTLEFTINNPDRDNMATSIAFTDDLDATISGLQATILPAAGTACNGGTISGTSLLSFTGGTLPPQGSCMFSVTLLVPPGTSFGSFTNTTTAITATIDGEGVTGNTATDNLVVSPAPLLTKVFTDDPVGGGGMVTLEFTITNTSLFSGATDITFLDELTTFLPFPVTVFLPPTPDPPCGGSMALVFIDDDRQGLELTGGSLAAAGTCTFSVVLAIPVGFPDGTYVNTTGEITATVDDETFAGAPASDTLSVVAPPMLMKEFTDDPVAPGGTVTLEFTLTHDALAPGDATGVTFTDDLDGAIIGLAASAGELPLTGLCPAGDGTLIGTDADTFLTFDDATLMPGDVCTFSVTLDVPGAATGGPHTNTTSSVVATVLGVTTTENPASDDLEITGLSLTKSFTDDPVIPGGTVTLEFTLENSHPTDDATSIIFDDDLGVVLPPGSPLTVSSGVPASPCGGSLTESGGKLSFSGGSLMAGAPPCTFSVTLDVPLGTASDTYPNATGFNFAVLGVTPVFFDPATDDLIVASDLLSLTKSFTDDPVAPGGTVTLEFTIANLDTGTITDIEFTDDLEAALAGLAPAAGGLPADGFCGPMSSLTFMTGELTLADGMLTSSEICTFSVTLDVPTPATGPATNTTSAVSGDVSGLPVTGDPASDDLLIERITFSKMFSVPVPPGGTPQAGGTVTLTFTITNLDTSAGVSDLEFADDLSATLAGLTATGLPSVPCAAGSSISGTSLLTFTGGNLLPGGSCTFEVDLLLPLTPLAGTFPNTTTDLTISGLSVASAAADDLVIATDIPNTVSADASNADPVMVTITTTVTAPP